MLNESFNDYFAQKDNFLHRIDARIKILYVFGAMIINLFSHTAYISMFIILISFVSLLSVKIPIKTIVLRMSAPLFIALGMLVLQIFFNGNIPLFDYTFSGFHFTAYKEGLTHGILISSRIIAGVSLILFLSMTTPANTLFAASCWFKIPKVFIEIVMITYRYIFVLIEDAITIKDAQKIRLGYTNYGRSIRSLGELAGAVFIRGFDQCTRVFESMNIRGYTGTLKIDYENKIDISDIVSGFIFFLILSILIIINFYWV